jgi:hypothetical protein
VVYCRSGFVYFEGHSTGDYYSMIIIRGGDRREIGHLCDILCPTDAGEQDYWTRNVFGPRYGHCTDVSDLLVSRHDTRGAGHIIY